jgi:Zn-finger nucleic acid-binding protein
MRGVPRSLRTTGDPCLVLLPLSPSALPLQQPEILTSGVCVQHSGHSLCENCAKHMVGTEKSGSAFIRCPHCRAKTRWKSGKANLKVNITLQNMVDRVKKAQKEDEEQRREQERQRKKQEEMEAKRLAKANRTKEKASKAKECPTVDTNAAPAAEVLRLPRPSPLLDSGPATAIDAQGSASPLAASHSPHPPIIGGTTAPPPGKGEAAAAGWLSGSLSPFGAVDHLASEGEQHGAQEQPNPDAVAAFDAAIAALIAQDPRGRGQDQTDHAVASPIALHGAQELSLPPSSSSSSPPPSQSLHSGQHAPTSPRPQHLLDEVDEGMLLLPFVEESVQRKMERKERRERSARPGRDSDWDEARDRLSRSCHSRSPPSSRGRSEHRSRSQETDRHSRSRSRGRYSPLAPPLP